MLFCSRLVDFSRFYFIIGCLSRNILLVVICEGGNLSLSDYPLASSKPQVTRDISPGPHLPKEKETSHRGDIGWDRLMLRQFVLQSYSLFPRYKLFHNNYYEMLEFVSRVMGVIDYKVCAFVIYSFSLVSYDGSL
jgi:hypothetical protein